MKRLSIAKINEGYISNDIDYYYYNKYDFVDYIKQYDVDQYYGYKFDQLDGQIIIVVFKANNADNCKCSIDFGNSRYSGFVEKDIYVDDFNLAKEIVENFVNDMNLKSDGFYKMNDKVLQYFESVNMADYLP